MIPVDLMARQLDRFFRDVDEDFQSFYDVSKPIVPQIEVFASRHNIELEKGWKVQLAKHVKVQLQKTETSVPGNYLEKLIKLFNKFNH
jgi:hypothetical protein